LHFAIPHRSSLVEFGIIGYDLVQLRRAGGQDIDLCILSCNFVALCDHNPPTLQKNVMLVLQVQLLH